MQYILIIIFILLFLPIKVDIKMSLENESYILIYILGNKIKKINIEKLLIKIIAQNIANNKSKINKKIIFKSIKKLRYKKIDLEYGFKLENYVDSMYINIAITTIINCIIGSNADILNKTKISIRLVEAEKVFTYKFNCIFTTNIANTIFVLIDYIVNVVKERWNLKWQNIQLKV